MRVVERSVYELVNQSRTYTARPYHIVYLHCRQTQKAEREVTAPTTHAEVTATIDLTIVSRVYSFSLP